MEGCPGRSEAHDGVDQLFAAHLLNSRSFDLGIGILASNGSFDLQRELRGPQPRLNRLMLT